MSFARRTGMAASIPAWPRPSAALAPTFGTVVTFPRPAPRFPTAHENATVGRQTDSRRYALWALALSATLHLVLFAAIGSAIRERHAGLPSQSREPAIVQVDLPSAVSSPVTLRDEAARVPRAAPRHRAVAARRALATHPASVATAAVSPPPALPAATAVSQTTASHATSASAVASDESVGTPAAATGIPNVSVRMSTPATYLHSPQPDYPRAAREDEEEGLVVLRVRISPEGVPSEVRLDRSSGFSLLDRAAIAAVRHWTFTAATSGDRRIESWMRVPIRFRLRDP
jgi:protein TonB